VCGVKGNTAKPIPCGKGKERKKKKKFSVKKDIIHPVLQGERIERSAKESQETK